MILPPTPENIERAVQALRRGELVGMPTETVYGVAADARNSEAVRATFAAKGRPAENPLIVHLAGADLVGTVAGALSAEAQRLAGAFWPGPLTLVLPRGENLPDEVTAGLDSVAVRVPAHPVAHDLLSAFGGPITAPSANPFMGLSATRATDIDPKLAAKLALILDGGAGEVGLESTVVDVRDEVRLLRPGGISRSQIEAVLGHPVLVGPTKERRSPGMYRRHYAPRARLRLAERLEPEDFGITFDVPAHDGQVLLPRDPVAFGARLYATLHELDRIAPREIVVQIPPRTPEWDAIWDRLERASESV